MKKFIISVALSVLCSVFVYFAAVSNGIDRDVARFAAYMFYIVCLNLGVAVSR